MKIAHAAVWLDREEARIFHIARETFERTGVPVTHHLRPLPGDGDPVKMPRDAAALHPFFEDIAAHLADADEVLVVGPSGTKVAFVRYVEKHHRELARRLVVVEPCDHPSDGDLVAEIRKHFRALDRARA